MNVDNLVSMANQIGQFFEAMPDREEALEGIANHIRKFWAPRMRERLTAYFADQSGLQLSPIVWQALSCHSILPTPVPSNPLDPMKGTGGVEIDGATEA